MEVPRVTQNTKIWYALDDHKKGHNKVDYWTRKKKQSDTNVTELAGGNEEPYEVLSVIEIVR